MDVLYDLPLVLATGPISYGVLYPNGHGGSLAAPGLIDEIGAFDDFGVGLGEKLLYSVRFHAGAMGTANFTLDPADVFPADYSLMFGLTGAVPQNRIQFINASLNIAPVVNHPPVAANDSYSTAIGALLAVPAPLGVLSNDADSDGNPLTAVPASLPLHAKLHVQRGWQLQLFAPGRLSRRRQLHYQASDGQSLSNAATVRIHVAPPPVAFNDSATASEDTPLILNVLANDSDPTEGQPFAGVNIVANVPASTGTVIVNPNLTVTYFPSLNFNTTRPPAPAVTFTYQARSADGRLSNVATVSVAVQEVNDNPIALNDTLLAIKRSGGTGVDQPVAVLANDGIAPDVAESLRVTAVNGVNADAGGNTGPVPTALGGSVRLSNFQILYTSPPVSGNDSFAYKTSDFDSATGLPRGGAATATVAITVIDFVPKNVSGTVYVDTNNNGLIDGTEAGIQPLEIHLTGTNFTGVSVSATAFTNASGAYTFPGILPPLPGTQYTLSEIQPTNFSNGKDTNSTNNPLVANINPLDNLFTIQWSIADLSGDIAGLNFGEISTAVDHSLGILLLDAAGKVRFRSPATAR